MKYYLDQEFSEGIRKPIWWLPTIGSFNKPRWFIDLISIGIVCEDGREYEAVNKDFNWRYANDWVRKNVKPLLPPRYRYVFTKDEFGMDEHKITIRTDNPVYKTIEQIAADVKGFCNGEPVFYGYYADYDWTLFCSSLFGSMMELPGSFPMYCRDLKQELDDLAMSISAERIFPPGDEEVGLGQRLYYLKNHISYPQQTNEHSALADANWNLRLHNFIQTMRNEKKV